MHEWTHADLVGGHAALDFLNTVSDVEKSRQHTRLETWNDYLGWMAAAKVEQSQPVSGPKTSHSATLANLHELREVSYSIFSALAAGNTPNDKVLEKLQTFIKDAYEYADLTVERGELRWKLRKKDRALHVHRLVLLIDDFIRTADFRRLRECGRCTWLFLDTGRGHGRKWCDMRKCGNRAKSESFRSKHPTRV